MARSPPHLCGPQATHFSSPASIWLHHLPLRGQSVRQDLLCLLPWLSGIMCMYLLSSHLALVMQLYGQARCSGPCAVFSAEVGTHSVDVFIKPAPSFVDQARPIAGHGAEASNQTHGRRLFAVLPACSTLWETQSCNLRLHGASSDWHVRRQHAACESLCMRRGRWSTRLAWACSSAGAAAARRPAAAGGPCGAAGAALSGTPWTWLRMSTAPAAWSG